MANSKSLNYQIILKAKNDMNQAFTTGTNTNKPSINNINYYNNNHNFSNMSNTNQYNNYARTNPITGQTSNPTNMTSSNNPLNTKSSSSTNNPLIKNNIMNNDLNESYLKKSLRNYKNNSSTELPDKMNNYGMGSNTHYNNNAYNPITHNNSLYGNSSSNSYSNNTRGLSYEEVLRLKDKGMLESNNNFMNKNTQYNSNNSLPKTVSPYTNNAESSINKVNLGGTGSTNSGLKNNIYNNSLYNNSSHYDKYTSNILGLNSSIGHNSNTLNPTSSIPPKNSNDNEKRKPISSSFDEKYYMNTSNSTLGSLSTSNSLNSTSNTNSYQPMNNENNFGATVIGNNYNKKPLSPPTTSTMPTSSVINMPFSNPINNTINPAVYKLYGPVISVKDYSVKEEANYPYRDYMEDCYKVVDKFANESNIGYFSLYDGHGGKETSNFIKDRLAQLFEQNFKSQSSPSSVNYEKMLVEVFEKCDDEIKNRYWSEYTGSTACVVFTVKDNNNNYVIYSANAGDSRTILLNTEKNIVKRLSYDHKASDPAEINRLRKTGGTCFNGRVFGTLAVSRAFGDYEYKKFGICATPYVTKTLSQKGDKYIVIASDGVWDVLSDEDVLAISHKYGSSANELSDAILHISMDRGSLDNITVMVVAL